MKTPTAVVNLFGGKKISPLDFVRLMGTNANLSEYASLSTGRYNLVIGNGGFHMPVFSDSDPELLQKTLNRHCAKRFFVMPATYAGKDYTSETKQREICAYVLSVSNPKYWARCADICHTYGIKPTVCAVNGDNLYLYFIFSYTIPLWPQSRMIRRRQLRHLRDLFTVRNEEGEVRCIAGTKSNELTAPVYLSSDQIYQCGDFVNPQEWNRTILYL